MRISGTKPSWTRAAAPVGMLALLLAAGAARADAASDRQYCEALQSPSAKAVCLRDLKDSASQPAAAPAAKPAAAATTAAPAPAAAEKKPAAAAATGGAAPYKVVDGYKVDAETLKGFHTWRSAACDRCHGANQEGMVGPSLINSLKTLSKNDFLTTVKNGRLEKGMPSFGQNPTVAGNLDQLYAYLKGRSDGAITKAHVEAMP